MPSVRFNVSIPPDQLERLQSLLNPKQVKQALFQAVKRTADQIKTIEVDSIVEHSEMNRHAALGAVNVIVPRGDVPEGWVAVSGKGVPMIGFRPRFSSSGMTVTAGGELHAMPHVFRAEMKGTTNEGDEYSHVGAFYRERVNTPPPVTGAFSPMTMMMVQKGQLKPRDSITAPAASPDPAAGKDGRPSGKMMGKRTSMKAGKQAIASRPGGVKAGFAERLPIRQVYGPSAASLADKKEIEGQVKERLDEIMQHNLDSQVDRFLKDAK